MADVKKIEPVFAAEKQKLVKAYPIIGGENADQIVAYKVDGVILSLSEFLAKYDLEFDKK